MPKQKNYLFLCGCPRSGTSELTRILSTHPDFVIGMEKYLNHRVKDDLSQLTPEILEKESFFNMDYERKNFPEGRNKKLDAMYEPMRERYDDAKYVGDKDPTYFRVYDYLLNTFPNVKIICMLRNVYDVAHSWTVRAERRNQPDTDYRMGLNFWNDSVKESWKFCPDHQDKIIICEYDKLYSDTPDYYHKLLSWLEVDTDPDNEAYVKASLEKARELRDKPRENSPEAIAHIKEHAKLEEAESLVEQYGL